MNWKLLVAAAAIGLAVPAGGAAQEAGADLQPELGLDDVLPTDPFGDIDIALAAGADGDISDWAMKLDGNQRNELTARCRVIEDHADTYDEASREFCTKWLAFDQQTNPQR